MRKEGIFMTETKVLVVDDEQNIRLLLSQCLEEAGYQVKIGRAHV